MKRTLIAASLGLAMIAGIPADAELVSSSCTHPMIAGQETSCSILPAGPVMTITGTAEPDESGLASVQVRLMDSQRLRVLLECSATAIGETASCTAYSAPALTNVTPTVIGQYNGGGLPLRCFAKGSGTGSFRCKAGTP